MAARQLAAKRPGFLNREERRMGVVLVGDAVGVEQRIELGLARLGIVGHSESLVNPSAH